MGKGKFKMKNEKELLDALKEVNKMLEKLIDNDGATDVLSERIKKAHNESALISIKKDKDGRAEVKLEGTNLSLLITLAGLEKAVLEKTHVPTEIWDAIKKSVGTMEAE